ncbi:MAG: TlyA family RNA methyltransferase [Ilumatobacteraceae bacterium]
MVLVKRELASSLEAAESLIVAGRVLVNGAIAMTGAHRVAPNDSIRIVEPSRFVSRGGEKLQGAIDNFKLDFVGKSVLDAGASTGGFADCALQAGAAHVTALDVGRALLHERVANDPRVVVVDECNIRNISDRQVNSQIRDLYDIVVADLSFISLTAVADALCSRVSTDGVLVLLIKPQFEATKSEVDKGAGVITDPVIHRRVCDLVTEAYQTRGCVFNGIMPSPIRGATGNCEFLLYLRRGKSS